MLYEQQLFETQFPQKKKKLSKNAILSMFNSARYDVDVYREPYLHCSRY